MKKNSILSYHMSEIRIRIFYLIISVIITFLTCYNVSRELVYIFIRPFFFFEKNFIFTDLTEAFYTYIKIYLIICFFTSFPYLIYQFWCFFIPSMYKNERKKINNLIYCVICIFFISTYFSYFLIIPEICKFLLNFEINSEIVTIQLEARIHPYVQLTFKLFIFLLFLFQIPIIIKILYYFNKITPLFFSNYRKYFLLFCIIISSFLAPPEILSQLLISFFFFLIFELIIWLGFFHCKCFFLKEKYTVNNFLN